MASAEIVRWACPTRWHEFVETCCSEQISALVSASIPIFIPNSDSALASSPIHSPAPISTAKQVPISSPTFMLIDAPSPHTVPISPCISISVPTPAPVLKTISVAPRIPDSIENHGILQLESYLPSAPLFRSQTPTISLPQPQLQPNFQPELAPALYRGHQPAQPRLTIPILAPFAPRPDIMARPSWNLELARRFINTQHAKRRFAHLNESRAGTNATGCGQPKTRTDPKL